MNRKLLYTLIPLFLLHTLASGQAPVAKFTQTVTSGCASLLVGFTDESSGTGPLSYKWNFGASATPATSTSANPTVIFGVSGTYNVTEIVTNGSGSDTAKVTITVFPTPVVNFTASSTIGCFPMAVSFTDQTNPGPGATEVKWSWDMGNSQLSNSQNPSDVYRNSGQFQVYLAVTNSFGCTGDTTKTKYIQVNGGVTPSFSDVIAGSCKPPTAVTFNNGTTGPPGSTLTYHWTFGDGAFSGIANPGHTYNAAATYPVTLTATATLGAEVCTDSTTEPVQITSSSVSSTFTAPATACVGTPVTFTNTSNPYPGQSNWTFGDGGTSNANSPSHTYLAANTYTVTLINNFGTCTDSIEHTIQILNPPVAKFIATNSTVSCKPPLTVNFQDQSTGVGINSWQWNFGDGGTSNMQNPSHTYTTYGYFAVTLTVSNGNGCSNTITKNQFVEVVAPAVHISDLPGFGCAPYTFTATLADTVVDGVASYSWNFGNGNTYNVANPPAQIYGPGTYTVSLTIVSTGGCSASTSGTVQVGTVKPTPSFTDVPNPACVGQNVTFTSTSGGAPNLFLWKYGDGNSQMGNFPTVTHAYSAPGSYTVWLTAFNNGCLDSISQNIVVNQPLSKFGYSYSCGNKNQFSFKDFSTGPTSWSWTFGDGGTSFAQNPIYTYAVPGNYTVTLTVTNAVTGCSNSSSQVVGVLAGTDFTINPNPVCRNSTVTVSATNPQNIATYIYNFGDGTIIAAASPIWTHVYTTAGNYIIQVNYIDNNGCDDSVSHPVRVNGPTVGMMANDTLSCSPLNAVFKDTSKTDGTHAIVSWSWNFGDGSPVSNVQNPTHPYNFQGIYSVSFKVTDASGCSDSLFKGNWIVVSLPSPSFSVTDSSCPGSNVKFTNTSSGGFSPTYNWIFGNGSIYSGVNPPPQTYPSETTYNPKLILIDSYGCTDSVSHSVFIDTPKASFTIDKKFIACPPLVSHFTFTGSYADSLDWILGDGSIVGGDSVTLTHTYSLPGTYYISLTATSPGGCSAQAFDTVTVLGPTGSLSISPIRGCDSLDVNFKDIASGVVKYIWIFGDNTTDTTTIDSTTHHYVSPPNFTGAYYPAVALIDSNNCQVPYFGDSILVVGIKPQFNVSSPVTCGTNNFTFTDHTLTNGIITNYFWDFNDGTTQNGLNPVVTHSYAAQGFYTVKMVVTTQFGCQDSTTMVVKVVANPVVDINGANSVCVPATETFTGIIVVPDTSVLTWAWTFYNGQTSTQQNPPAQNYLTAGSDSVTVIATNSTGCTDTVTKYFTIFPLPPVNAGADTTICLGQSLPLQATGAVSYTWQPPGTSTLSCTNCSNPVATPSFTTSYVVTGTSSFGCQASDTILVTVNRPDTVIVASSLDSVCIGKSVQLSASGATIYAWTPAGSLNNPAIANPIATPGATTTYQVIGSDNKFCFSDTQFVQVTVFNYPTLNVGSNVTIPVGSSYQVTGTGSPDIVSINWLPVTGLSCSNCLSPLATPMSTTTYVVTAVNNGNCPIVDSLKITVVCTDNNLFVPNTFSPNGDGVNDVFYVRGKGLHIIPSIMIFNRWGQIVFEKTDFAPNDPSAGWDGTFNGKPAPQDVYIYTIQVICDNSTLLPYHGNVALIR